MTKNNNFPFPPEKELKEMCQKLSAPDYPYVNYILPANANSEEKMKYSLCKAIVRYQRENKLSEAKLAKIMGIGKEKLIDVLFAKTYKLELTELLIYFDNLHLPFEVNITNSKPREISYR